MQKWIDWLNAYALASFCPMFERHVKFLLKDGDFTEESLATALGISQSTVNRIKQGQMPRYDVGLSLVRLYEETKNR